MPRVIRWLYLNIKYRVCPPERTRHTAKLAMKLNISLAFTYRRHGRDVILAQQRIRENLNSFRWIAPLVLCFSLVCFASMVIIMVLILLCR